MSKTHEQSSSNSLGEEVLLNPLLQKAPLRLRSRHSISKNVLKAAADCRKSWSENKKGYRARKYELIQVIYAVAIELHRNKPKWRAFLKDHFFESERQKPKPGNRRDLLRATVNYVVDTHQDHERAAASKLVGVLLWLMDRSTPADEVAGTIRANGGIEKVYKAWTESSSGKVADLNDSIGAKSSENIAGCEYNTD